MPTFAERAYYELCLALGRLLRSARYAEARIVRQDGSPEVHKRRTSYAPFLVGLGGPLVSVLDAGVRVLPQHEWEDRERLIYATFRGSPIRIEPDGTLVLPCLPGETLTTLLEDRRLGQSGREKAIELAVASLAGFHARGFTHGDAMAENVLVDFQAGVAHWIDFETVHDSSRSLHWRQADDLRALLATSLLRTSPGELPTTLNLVLDIYADKAVTRLVAESFASIIRRPLLFHLGQAGLSFERSRDIARLLSERLTQSE